MGVGGCWWVLGGVGGCWWVLVGVGGCWWVLVGVGEAAGQPTAISNLTDMLNAGRMLKAEAGTPCVPQGVHGQRARASADILPTVFGAIRAEAVLDFENLHFLPKNEKGREKKKQQGIEEDSGMSRGRPR